MRGGKSPRLPLPGRAGHERSNFLITVPEPQFVERLSGQCECQNRVTLARPWICRCRQRSTDTRKPQRPGGEEIEGLISESVRLIDLGSDEVATAGKIMCTIVDAVASVTHIMQEIATASGEQSRGITQVSQAISEMDKVTQQNASLVEEASTAAVSLEEQAARLTEAVDVFRLNKHSVSAEPRGACEPVSFATV